ncbi:MAG TPA: hypothetical protein VGB56_00050 [Flavisolibacter sp.]|jgi:hypothetical protein
MDASPSDIQFLEARYRKARNKYKPRQVKTLFIAEGPPNSLDRHFYFEDVKQHDSLFLEIMGILYPEQKQRYLSSRRDTILKTELLESFQEDGYWLMHLSEIPCNLNAPLPTLVPSLLLRLQKEIDKETPIILIKSSLYDLCYKLLVLQGYKVSNERIPFPGSGQQGVFREKVRKALASF